MLAQLIEFVGNHWILFIALVVISALLIHNLIVGDRGSIDPLGATDLINHKDATVIDVRPSADYTKGHIINAISIPMNGFRNQTATLAKHKNKPLIISCRSGSQSQMACGILRKQGFEEVYNLRGGVMAWQNANLPLTRKKH
ncbi:rhodanese-like domain-containing protein [Thiorhodovibrio frisius]|uniref:Rhodanese-related sulfurtransferase n=1 Tax=Thiorhodovibrio frisius TaxID=631362 RepID=H8YZF7_9GAMM|nr:rhodanese-like domain-containing protein [Thiorhodovibrio frisius]EIC22084.1 Rhodanese-related sulfurtransferase [Thiorhodovibrio frisius]WPL24377.1 Thiosulfate sulfurtransferase PspE precursor [Thiorhodovibrio frisius]